MTIKQRVKIACEKAEINLGEIAFKMGMSQSTFSIRLKTGKFTIKELMNIADIIGCKYKSFFRFDDGSIIQSHSAMGCQIKDALNHVNMSATDLGRKMNISQPAISKRLKTGKFTQDELSNIAAMMDCEYISQFIFRDGMIL